MGGSVQIPLKVRAVSYLVGLFAVTFGSGTVSWLLAKGIIDNLDAAFGLVIVSGISAIAHVLCLSNLNFNSLPNQPPQ